MRYATCKRQVFGCRTLHSLPGRTAGYVMRRAACLLWSGGSAEMLSALRFGSPAGSRQPRVARQILRAPQSPPFAWVAGPDRARRIRAACRAWLPVRPCLMPAGLPAGSACRPVQRARLGGWGCALLMKSPCAGLDLAAGQTPAGRPSADAAGWASVQLAARPASAARWAITISRYKLV